MTEIGKRIRDLYEGKNMTQEQVARDVLGVTPAALSRAMRGRMGLPVSWLIALSDYFGCSIDQIVKGDTQ